MMKILFLCSSRFFVLLCFFAANQNGSFLHWGPRDATADTQCKHHSCGGFMRTSTHAMHLVCDVIAGANLEREPGWEAHYQPLIQEFKYYRFTKDCTMFATEM